MNRINKFQESHLAAMKSIQNFTLPGIYEPHMDGLVKWMLNTEANPYSYLGQNGGALSSAEQFDGLLNSIHHALYDDGEMEFVTVNDEPRIVFSHRENTYFRDDVLTSQEKSMEQSYDKTKFEIAVLEINPNEFGALYDAYNLKRIKECFAMDAASQSIEFAVEHYRSYSCFSEDWIEECKEEIQKYIKFYSKLN